MLVDDKLRILSAVKAAWGARVTTVFPRQGHYALDPKALAASTRAISPSSASATSRTTTCPRSGRARRPGDDRMVRSAVPARGVLTREDLVIAQPGHAILFTRGREETP